MSETGSVSTAALALGGADPFAVTSDPGAYVPRPATEAALAELEAALRGDEPCIALTGPPGIGKTILLRVLSARLGEQLRFVYLPYAALSIDDLARWILDQLDTAPLPDAGDHPVAALGRACRMSDRPVVIGIDDASALRSDAARALRALAHSSEGALRLIAIPVDDRHAGRVLAALGPDVVEVRLQDPLTRAELSDYVRSRLERADAPKETAERFDGQVLSWLHRDSRGIPRRVHELATRFLLEGELEHPGSRHRREGDWLELDTAEVGREPIATDLVRAPDPGAARGPSAPAHRPLSSLRWLAPLLLGVVLGIAWSIARV